MERINIYRDCYLISKDQVQRLNYCLVLRPKIKVQHVSTYT